ncbi:Syntaxin-1A -like protein [Halotydeus destructor]|nr:Syntaxin-1A -like protein [Halotydeus destructor]
MARDRLADLRLAAQRAHGTRGRRESQQQQEEAEEGAADDQQPGGLDGGGGGDSVSIQMQQQHHGGGDPMAAFLGQVDAVNADIADMEESVARVSKLHSAILSQPSQSDAEKSQAALDALMGHIQAAARRVRAQLKLMDSDQVLGQDGGEGSAEQRIRRTQSEALRGRVLRAMQSYNETQSDYRQRCRARIQRQLDIVHGHSPQQEGADQDVVDDMLDEGLVNPPMAFTQGIILLPGSQSSAASQQRRLADIEARQADIVHLEQSLRDLQDLFLDMALLVDSQGDLVDRIEHHVQQSRDFVDAGTRETAKAVLYQSQARTKKLVLLLVLVAVGLVVAGAIYSSVK